jgi:hypothetical protein
VHDQRIAGRQAYELVLPATNDAADYRATQPTDVTRWQATALRWVQNFYVADRFPQDCRTQDAGRILDFG